MVSFMKLPILKKGEYILWIMKMEQYLAHTDYALWEVILNDEHLARFYGIKDAKTLWATIKTRFDEGLDKRYDRFQSLLSLLEIHEAGVSTEDANQKFLRSLPSAWSNISLIMRNKPGIDTLDIDDLYNNLKVYKANIKGSSESSLNSQNVAFVSTESTAALMNLMLLIVFLLLHVIVLRHKMAMLSMRVKQFYKKTGRKLEFNGKEPAGFDKKQGNKSRDARNAGYRGRDNGKRPVKAKDEQALVVQDGLGTYDWSYQVEEEATDIALMAFTSNPSSFSGSNSEYNLVLNNLDEALKEKEDLKAKLEKFETSLKNLTKVLDSQISAKVKTGLGYDSKLNEKEVLDIKEEEVTEIVFDNRSSDDQNSVANDRFNKGEGYHAVPPPLTGNYMPPKPDLSFSGLDDSIYKFKISETVTSLAKDENDAFKTSTAFVEKPKEDRSSAFLIED
nr:hypothetical protein [Tanacetum cinerariifolium]